MTKQQSKTAVANPGVVKPGRGEFKCFRCRKILPSKEGDWFPWKEMEVHLCKSCDKETTNSPERRGR